jgi:hypothetical protein
MAEKPRDKKGRYASSTTSRKKKSQFVSKDHSYNTTVTIPSLSDPPDDTWKEGRRLVEFGVLLSKLQHCEACRLGPVALTYESVVGELQKGLGGYLYVRCSNHDCGHINRVPYGSTHRVKERGMPCFSVNTKLGTGE